MYISLANKHKSVSGVIDKLVASHGTGSHDYIHSEKLRYGANAIRNMADAVYFLCLLHGRHPGVIDYAASKILDSDIKAWLERAAESFVSERAYLSQIVSVAGPLPSTPDQTRCEAAISGKRRVLNMLASSERRGCAVGAAVALIFEWRTMRILLDSNAQKIEIDPPTCTLPSLSEAARIVNGYADDSSTERALLFGARQLVDQHSGLWDLMKAREEARSPRNKWRGP